MRLSFFSRFTSTLHPRVKNLNDMLHPPHISGLENQRTGPLEHVRNLHRPTGHNDIVHIKICRDEQYQKASAQRYHQRDRHHETIGNDRTRIQNSKEKLKNSVDEIHVCIRTRSRPIVPPTLSPRRAKCTFHELPE